MGNIVVSLFLIRAVFVDYILVQIDKLDSFRLDRDDILEVGKYLVGTKKPIQVLNINKIQTDEQTEN